MRKNLIHTETFQHTKIRCHQHHHVSPKTGKLLKRILSTSAWDHMLKCDHKDDFDILQNLTTACLKCNGACSSKLKNPIQIGCYAYKNYSYFEIISLLSSLLVFCKSFLQKTLLQIFFTENAFANLFYRKRLITKSDYDLTLNNTDSPLSLWRFVKKLIKLRHVE